MPSAIKSLANNAKLILILNRLGHSVSYSQVEEIDTALCLQKLASTPDACVPLPDNIHPHVPATVSWDNVDRTEDTLPGAGTSHRVNGIVVVLSVSGQAPTLQLQTNIPKDKQRSIKPIDLNIVVYSAGERSGPAPRPYVAVDNNMVIEDAKRKNMLWLLTRYTVLQIKLYLHGLVQHKSWR